MILILRVFAFLEREKSGSKACEDSNEIPDGETTVSCTNLLKTLNFQRRKC